MSELEKMFQIELQQDEDFIKKVHSRIYADTDDWEQTIAEPEWICKMTDIADKYLGRSKAQQVIISKLLEKNRTKQPQLNENQQIVLDAFKKEYQDGELFPLALIHSSLDKGFSKQERVAYVSLTRLQEAEVLQVFTTWMLEQEESE